MLPLSVKHKAFKRIPPHKEKPISIGNVIMGFVILIMVLWIVINTMVWDKTMKSISNSFHSINNNNNNKDGINVYTESHVLDNIVRTSTNHNNMNDKVTIDNSIPMTDPHTTPRDNIPHVHLVFSTDCEVFQDWQSVVLFHSAMLVNQPGNITRIASGCSEVKKTQLIQLYNKLFPQYTIHFTPDFKKDSKTGHKYHFYNKPYGLYHWLTHSTPRLTNDTIIVLLDPDMVILRPITAHIQSLDNILNHKHTRVPELPEYVSRGYPVGQLYGLDAPWARSPPMKHFNRTRICGVNSPCLRESESHAALHYSIGPPYLVEYSDMVRIAASWTKMVPYVYEGYPELLAEMYAYSMAAAHEELPHIQLEQYMVSVYI